MNMFQPLVEHERTKTHLVRMRSLARIGAAELENARLMFTIYQRDHKLMPKHIRKQFKMLIEHAARSAHSLLWIAYHGGYTEALDPHLED